MMKKLDSLTESMTDNQLVSSILESANQIWLAGLGAFAKAQQEGTKVFEALVKEGEAVQERAKKVAGDKVAEVSSKASGTWDKLEEVFEGRVARALHSLSVPTKKDIDALGHRVAELTTVVEKLSTVTAERGAKPSGRETAEKSTTKAPHHAEPS